MELTPSQKKWTTDINEAIRFLSYLMIENLSEIIINNLLYSLRDARPKLNKFRFERSFLLLVFATLPKSATNALNIVRLQLPLVRLEGLDKDGNVWMRSDIQ